MNELLNNLVSDKKKLILVVLFFAIIAYLDVSVIIKSQLAGVKQKESQIKDLNLKLTTFERDLAKMQEQMKKESAGSADRQKGRKLLSHDSIAALLQGISGLANKNNIRILKATPKDAQPAQAKGAPAPAAAPAVMQFSPVTIELILSCDYHSFGIFVNEVENDQVPVLVQEFSIIADKQAPLKQRVTVILKTYVKK